MPSQAAHFNNRRCILESGSRCQEASHAMLSSQESEKVDRDQGCAIRGHGKV